MEPRYYSPDDEIAWGPLTVPEIREELESAPRVVKGRQTDFGHSTFYTPSTTFDEKVPEDKTNSSGTSAYFTPDESMAHAVDQKNVFLEKLSQVIGSDDDKVAPPKTQLEECSETKCSGMSDLEEEEDKSRKRIAKIKQFIVDASEFLPEDTDICYKLNPHEEDLSDRLLKKLSQVVERDLPRTELECNETRINLMNILDQEEDEDCKIIDHIQQSLVDNTILSPEKASSQDDSNDDIIVISDDSSDDLEHKLAQMELECEFQMKEEPQSLTQEEFSILNESSSSSDYSCGDVGDQLLQRQYQVEVEKRPQSNLPREINISNRFNSDSSSDESVVLLADVVAQVLSDTEPAPKETNSEDESSLKYSDEPKIQTASTDPDLSDASYSQVFNDTMEEIEMALKQGLDYEMPSYNKLSTFEAPALLNPVKSQITTRRFKPTPSKYDYVQSPIADYIKKSPMHDNFKLPTRPPKHKITPNPKSPLVQTNQFKNIMSPVGVYIKNNQQVLKQNVPVKTVPSLKPAITPELVQKQKDFVAFPEVVYRPGRKIVTCEKKDIVLPCSIQKMVPEPAITKHESRIARPINKGGVSRKLLDGDLTTVNASLLNQSEDVSFVHVKQAFIK